MLVPSAGFGMADFHLKRTLPFILASLFSAGLFLSSTEVAVAQGNKSLEGWVTNSKCGDQGPQHTVDTIKKCVAQGAKYVLQAKDEEAYEIDPQSLGEEHAGQRVRVSGAIEGQTIHVRILQVVTPLAGSFELIEQDESFGDGSLKLGRPREALSYYLSALQELAGATDAPADMDERLREKIIKAVLQLNPPPAIPQEAVRHAVYAQAALEDAQKDANPSHLNDAISETEEALRIAPWWAQAYFNLGELLQRAHRPGEAAQALQLYLLADPQALLAKKNGMSAQDVQVEVYKLQYEAGQH